MIEIPYGLISARVWVHNELQGKDFPIDVELAIEIDIEGKLKVMGMIPIDETDESVN